MKNWREIEEILTLLEELCASYTVKEDDKMKEVLDGRTIQAIDPLRSRKVS